MTQKSEKRWITAAAAAQFEAMPAAAADTAHCTVRAALRLKVSGEACRIVLSERYSAAPVYYGRIAVKIGDTLTELCFDGKADVVVLPGTARCSDPVYQPVKAGDTLTLWLYNAGDTVSTSLCRYVQTHSAPGDFCGRRFAAAPFQFRLGNGTECPESLAGVCGVEVLTGSAPHAIAAYGDSITAMDLWPAPLQRRLGETPLFNLAVSGARLLRDTHFLPAPGVQLFGRAALERMEWDLFARPGLTGVIFALGVNDLSQPDDAVVPLDELCTADELIDGMQRFLDRVRARGLKAAGGTVTPFGGYPSFDARREVMRRTANDWILTSGAFDAVIDFAAAVCCPDDPSRLLPRFDSGDHLHPSPAGGCAMAECVDIDLLKAW